jgi:hypothetical protein
MRGINLAEREGFEPSEPLPAHLFSRQANSTTLAPLLVSAGFGYCNRLVQPPTGLLGLVNKIIL